MTETQLVAFLSEMGVKGLISSGGNVRGCCPIHGENNPSFGVSIYKDGHPWNCFSCGNSGLTIRSLCAKVWSDVSKREIERRIDAAGGAVVVEVDKGSVPEEKASLQWFRAFPFQESLRDISAETLRAAELRRYEYGSVLVPYFTCGLGDEFVGVVLYNHAKDTDVKVMPLYKFKHRQHLFRPKMCTTDAPIILVEGVYDALKVYESGFTNVAAVGGATLTNNQQREVGYLSDKTIVVMPDKDAGGSALLNSVLEKFHQHIVFVADKYDGSDPGDSTPEGIKNAVSNKRMIL